MRRIALLFILIFAVMVTGSTLGFAAKQSVEVLVPATAMIILGQQNVTFNFPNINTWTSDTNTQTSNDFYVISYINTRVNPDMIVSSSPLQRVGGGATIPLSGFRVYRTSGAIASGTLDHFVRFSDVGAGLRFTTVHYSLTIDAGQQSGTYTGLVTYSLVNT